MLFLSNGMYFQLAIMDKLKRPKCFAVEDVEDVDRSYAQTVAKRFGLVLTD